MTALAINTADSTVITADTVSFTADGADLTNGGATDLVGSGLSRTVSIPLFVPIYGTSGVNVPYPILYPAQTFYVGGAAVTV